MASNLMTSKGPIELTGWLVNVRGLSNVPQESLRSYQKSRRSHGAVRSYRFHAGSSVCQLKRTGSSTCELRRQFELAIEPALHAEWCQLTSIAIPPIR